MEKSSFSSLHTHSCAASCTRTYAQSKQRHTLNKIERHHVYPEDISQNKPLLWLMAAACGLCAGVNYYCQPLIHSIQQDFAVTQAQAALTVTFAQVSYALKLTLYCSDG